MAPSLHSSKKLFGHCRVEWQIGNFSLQTFSEKWMIQSPEFTINGSEETSWYMNLKTEVKDKSRCVLFSLLRSATDSGPKYTKLDFKMQCIGSDSKSYYFYKKSLSLKNGSKYEVCLGAIEYLMLQMNRLDDLFTIVCNMIVYSDNPSKEFGECHDAGIKLLSKNMLDLYRSAQNFDTKIVFDDNIILAHRAILCARNAFLKFIIIGDDDDVEIEDVPECTIINFTDRFDYKAMGKILAYLYTGDMRHVLEEPSFAIHDCASFLGISEIETCYKPDELVLKSTVDLEEYTYVLSGYRFENSRFVLCADAGNNAQTYQLFFYPESEQNVLLFTRTFEKPMNAYIELTFADKNSHLCTTAVEGKITNIDKIISETVQKLYSSHNISEVTLKLKLTAGMSISYIAEHESVFASYVNEDFPYRCLSEDLEFLFDGGHFDDTIIDNDGTYFRVHKCILASRSRFFLDMLKAHEEGEVLVVSNIAPRIVSLLLTYIYAGILSINDDFLINDDVIINDDFIDVYKAAVWSNLSQLKSMCSDSLQQLCKTNAGIRCRVVRLAEKFEDDSLMTSVLNNLFDMRNAISIPNPQLLLRDVHSCRYCRVPL